MSAIPLRWIEGKYEILEKLGEGGMGAVYKVRHRLLDDVRVVKMMRPQLVADDEFKARFQREARVAIQLRHPNIAHLIDFTIDEDDGTAFIVMEFIDGMTLEEVLRHGGPPPLGLALEIAQQSLLAVGFLHAKGFVHRDISPDNLMLTADADGRPQVKLIDLGIAKVLDAGIEAKHLTGTGIFLGKVRYSPPEQFGTEGAAMVDARGDLYSFGVVLYELLTGRYPIQGRDPSSLIGGHLFRPPLDFAESDPEGLIPQPLRALVLRALAKDPAERFASARELALSLAALRTPDDVPEGALKRALTRLPSGTVRVPLPPPGSTQDRLDLQFGLRTTPSRGGELKPPSGRRSPESELRVRTLLREAEALLGRDDFAAALEHLERGKALSPGNPEILALLDKAEAAVRERQREHDLESAQGEIEAALARNDFRAAEMRLYQAEASLGEQEVFSLLHERLGELRRRNLEARRRAERLAAEAGRVEAALAQGDLEEAGRRLATAVEACGEEAALAGLAERLAALRQESREAARRAEIAARVAGAARRRDADDLAGALAEARGVLEEEPGNAAAQALAGEVSAEIARRESAAREAARQAEIAARLAVAGERRAAGDLDGAVAEVRQVLALEGENAAARALGEEIEAERRRREDEAERAARLAATVGAIGERLEAEDWAAAGVLLDEVAAAFGEADGLGELRRRLDEGWRAEQARTEAAEAQRRHQEEAAEAERRRQEAEIEAERRRLEDEARQAAELAAREAAQAAKEAEIAGLLARARELRAADDLEGALRAARRVFGLEAENVEAWGMVAEIEGERRHREEEERQAAQAAARQAEIEALLARAGERRAADDLEGTLTVARRVFALEAENPLALALVEEIEAERRRREKEAQRAEQLAAAVASIDECLAREDSDTAANLLPGIVAVFGNAPALRERWERIEELRRRKVRQRATFLLEAVRKLQAAGELEAALGALREAGSLLPEDPDVRSLTREIGEAVRQRDEESRQSSEEETAIAAIDGALERQDLATAARLLPAAVSRFGGLPALRESWGRLEALQRKARVDALHAEALSLVATGHRDRAARRLRQALELEPAHPEAASLLAELSRP